MSTPQTKSKTKCRLCIKIRNCSPIFDYEGLSNKILELLGIEILPTDKICINCRKIVDTVDNFPCTKDLWIKNQTEQPDSSVTECAIQRKSKRSEQLPRATSVDTFQRENTSESQITFDSPSNNSNDTANVNPIQPVDRVTINHLSTASPEYCPNSPSPEVFHDSHETSESHNIERPAPKTSRNEPNKADSFECKVCNRTFKSSQELRTHRFESHALRDPSLGLVNKDDDVEKSIEAEKDENGPQDSPAQGINNQENCAVNSTSPEVFHDSHETSESHNIERPTPKTSLNEPNKPDSFKCQVCDLEFKSSEELQKHSFDKHGVGDPSPGLVNNDDDDVEKPIEAKKDENGPHNSPAQGINNQENCAVNSTSLSASTLSIYSLQQMQGASSFSSNIDVSKLSYLITKLLLLIAETWQTDANTHILETSCFCFIKKR